MKRKQAPLRLITQRFPEPKGFVVRERLECGHEYTAYDYYDRERQAKRRRCHDCMTGRVERKPPGSAISWESGTAQFLKWK